MRNPPCARPALAAVILVLLGTSAPAAADTVWSHQADGPVAAEQHVTLLRVDEQYLVYTSPSAGERRARIRDVHRVQVEGEAALDRGEAAYADGRFEAAALGYERALRSTKRRAVQSWASVRLVRAGNQAGRLDMAALGFEFLLKHDPAAAIYFLPDVGMLWRGLGEAAAETYATGMRRLGTLHDELAGRPLTREQERAFAVFENHTAYTLDLFQRPGGGGGGDGAREAAGGGERGGRSTYTVHIRATAGGHERVFLPGTATLVTGECRQTREVLLYPGIELGYKADHVSVVLHDGRGASVTVQLLKDGEVVQEAVTSPGGPVHLRG